MSSLYLVIAVKLNFINLSRDSSGVPRKCSLLHRKLCFVKYLLVDFVRLI